MLPAPAVTVTATESFRPPVSEGEEVDESVEVKKLYTREDRLIAKQRRGPYHGADQATSASTDLRCGEIMTRCCHPRGHCHEEGTKDINVNERLNE
jgi:hypothetical protein